MAITSTEILQHCPAVWKLRNKLTRFMSLLKITAKGRQAGKGQVFISEADTCQEHQDCSILQPDSVH